MNRKTAGFSREESALSAAEALKASLTVLGRRLESVRFEMAEGVVRARKAAHFGNR